MKVKNEYLTEAILGLLFALKIPMLWQLKVYGDFSSLLYLLGWCLYSIGMIIGKNEMLAIILGVLSNIFLSISYNAPYSVSIVSYFLSMIAFGFSLGPFYLKNSYLFHLGSIAGCFIGALSSFCDLWLTKYNFLLYFVILVSAMPSFAYCWCRRSELDLDEILIPKEDSKDSFIKYPPHPIGVAITLALLFLSSGIMSYFLFIIPLLISEDSSVHYTYLLYGVFNVIYI